MRVIHLSSNRVWGGGEQYIMQLCKALVADGHRVTVFARKGCVPAGRFRDEGLDVREAAMRGEFDLPSAIAVSKALTADEECVIHAHNFKDAATALLARRLSRTNARVVVTRHLIKAGKRSLIHSMTYKGIDALIFVSHLALDGFMSGNPRIDRAKCTIIHNSIPTSSNLHSEPPTSDTIRMMFHGRIAPEKGVDTLIEALPVLKGKNTRLWIVGTGDTDYVDSLKRCAETLGVAEMIDWKGYLSDVHQLIPQCHFGVLPSKCTEAFGLANIEYMAHGRPQICSDNGAQTEYMTPGREALMTPPGDVSALGRALLEMVGSPELRERMGRDAYATFHRTLSWDCFHTAIMRVYHLQQP